MSSLRERNWIFDKSCGSVVFGDVLFERFEVAVELFDDLGVFFDEVVLFRDVSFEVVKRGEFIAFTVEFPVAGADGLEVVSGMVEECFVWGLGML